MASLLASVYSLGTLARNIYLADVFDVAIIAVLIYSVILLFKQTRSYLTLIGIAMLAIVYGFAQVFNLFLTSIALQSFFGVFFVVLAIVFQEELRRFFESIAIWSTRQRKQKPIATASAAMQGLIQALADLAHQKIGALVVLHGQENLERLIDGGEFLDGIITEELLLSIFDPSSPGHDGAMIINKSRIVKFGAHLPLSNNFKEIGKHGTRHSAALGISERSDALAIAVSEEQGTISICLGGRLKTLKNMEELKEFINRFLKEKFSEETYHVWENLLKKNSLEKLIAFVLAGLLWFVVAFPAGTLQRDFIIPVGYHNVPGELVVEQSYPKELVVTLAGRGSYAFDQLDTRTLNASLSGKDLQNGANTIDVNDSDIVRPINLSIVKISPAVVRVFVKKYTLFEASISVKTVGRPQTGFVIDSVKPLADRISAYVLEGLVAPKTISTEPIDVSGIAANKTVTTKLLLPSGTRLPQGIRDEVVVAITVKGK